MVGSMTFLQHVSIKRIAFRLAHLKPISFPIQCFGIDRINHYPMVLKEIYYLPMRLLDGRPKLSPLSSSLF